MKGLSGLGGLAGMMKQAQAMQERMKGLQDEMKDVEVTGESGAGLVRARASVAGDLVGLEIDPSILQASEKAVVEDLILAAVREAQSRAKEHNKKEMTRLFDELGLPPGFSSPFMS